MKCSRLKIAIIEQRLARSFFKKFYIKPLYYFDKLLSIPAIKSLSKKIDVNKNKIVFLTFSGEYDCNPKWICEEILKQELPYDLVWGVYPDCVDVKDFPNRVRIVKRGSFEFYKEMSSAGIIIDNSSSTAFLRYPKKSNQILIQTWHGSLGIKRFSIDSVSSRGWVRNMLREGRMTDYLISNSTFEDNVFREDYWKTSPILHYGHARNDILLEGETDRVKCIRDKVYSHFNLENDVNICLYAPTFRDDGDFSPYQLDFDGLVSALRSRFGGKWVVLTRFHYRLRSKLETLNLSESVINASSYPDIQELMSCAMVGVTDYSSWIFDFLLTKRPAFLFATDLSKYENDDRGFYYPISTTPFGIAKNNNELVNCVLTFDETDYKNHCDMFIKEKGCIDDGMATSRTVQKITEIINS